MAEKAKNDHSPQVEVYELAGLVERFGAYFIDDVILAIPTVIVVLLIMSPEHGIPAQFISFLLLAIPVVYHWYFLTRRNGQSLGKFALGIRVIKTNGTPLSDVDALIRAVGYRISGMLFGIGFVWALFDKRNQTWHDKMARTLVVRVDEQRKTIEIDV